MAEDVSPALLLKLLWRRRIVLIVAVVLSASVGAGYALLQPDRFKAISVLYPKVSPHEGSPQGLLGGLGGLVGSMASNSSLEKIKEVARSRSLLREMVESGDLMPRLFPSRWDAGKGSWRDSTKIPTLNQAVRKLEGMLNVKFEKGGSAFKVESEANDPVLCHRLNTLFVETLNARQKRNALAESKKNQEYLRTKNDEYADPYLKAKLDNLLVAEIERAMLIHSDALEVIDPPVVPDRKSGPRRAITVIAFAMTGFLSAAFGCLAKALVGEEPKRPRMPEA